MGQHIRYFKYVAIHKFYVFLACLKYGLIWRGLTHDLSKFTPSEWSPYVEYFYGKKVEHPTQNEFRDGKFMPVMEQPENVQRAFDIAWNYHQKRNSHHWQYWLLSPDNPRPNFWEQSMDGGMSESVIADKQGNMVALLYHESVKWLKPNYPLIKQLNNDLLNTPVPLKMPLNDAKEMIADWIGAGKALGRPKTWEWYEQNKDNMQLHPDTRIWVEGELAKLKADYALDMKGQAMGFMGRSWLD